MKIDILLFNKPYRVLSQFTDKRNEASIDGKSRQTLADFIQQPKFYPAGRLDFLSEGLMALTDNGALQQRISSPEQKMEKSYWVLGCPSKKCYSVLTALSLKTDSPNVQKYNDLNKRHSSGGVNRRCSTQRT